MTPRGRVAVTVALVLLLLGAFLAGRASEVASADTGAATSAVIVQPGQSLWEIAGQVAPGADRRATMADIEQLNRDTLRTLKVGQTLRVPGR